MRGKSVNIVQVAGTDSFWAGRNEKQRILVKLNLKGGKGPPKLEAGRQADFVGRLTRRRQREEPSLLGVKDEVRAAGAPEQGVYILVSVGDLKLH